MNVLHKLGDLVDSVYDWWARETYPIEVSPDVTKVGPGHYLVGKEKPISPNYKPPVVKPRPDYEQMRKDYKHGDKCDHPFTYGLSPGFEDVNFTECIVCRETFAHYTLCECKPWQYISLPPLNMSGRCSHCNLFRTEDEVR